MVGSTGVGGGGAAAQTNTGTVYISLKPSSQRDSMATVMTRLRRKLNQAHGGRLYRNPVQDLRIGRRSGKAEYQYTILGDSTAEVYAWAPKLLAAVQNDPALADVSSDQQQRGLETDFSIDRELQRLERRVRVDVSGNQAVASCFLEL
jgi:multidrug efflux pump